MTKTLILIRHAKSDWGDPLLDDHERRLNDRGRRDAPRIGRWLAEQGAIPDLVLSSDAVRTRETWALLAACFDTPPDVRFLPDLYHASPTTILNAVAQATADIVAIVAHNPGIGDLANRLGQSDNPRFRTYPTAATAIFDTSRPKASLTAFITPNDLP